MVKKIALIGSGSALAKNFIDYCKDNNSVQLLGLQRTKQKNRNNVTFHQLLRGTPKEKTVLDDVSAVIYFIGTNVGSDEELDNVNISTLKNYLKIHPENIPFIFISSVAVLTQDGHYAHVKKVCEKLIREKVKTYMILRPSLLYGKHDKNNLYSLNQKIKWLPLIPSPPKEHKIQPVHMTDLSAFMFKIIDENLFQNKELTCSNPSPVSSYEVIKSMADEYSGPKAVVPIPLRVVHLLVKIVSIILPSFDLKSQLENMTEHEPFDSSEAIKLGYQARKYRGL